MKRIVFLAALALSGCGPLAMPAVHRLDPDQQKQVDDGWNNMLNPTNRIDRELLLDVVDTYELYQYGIDRLHFQSEKDFDGGTVVMTIDFNRANDPDTDRFTVCILDKSGHTLRKETYSGEEVESHSNALMKADSVVSASTRPDDKLTADEVAQRAWYEARMKQINAATEPADAPPAKDAPSNKSADHK